MGQAQFQALGAQLLADPAVNCRGGNGARRRPRQPLIVDFLVPGREEQAGPGTHLPRPGGYRIPAQPRFLQVDQAGPVGAIEDGGSAQRVADIDLRGQDRLAQAYAGAVLAQLAHADVGPAALAVGGLRPHVEQAAPFDVAGG